jgi:hypothetical protein
MRAEFSETLLSQSPGSAARPVRWQKGSDLNDAPDRNHAVMRQAEEAGHLADVAAMNSALRPARTHPIAVSSSRMVGIDAGPSSLGGGMVVAQAHRDLTKD